MKFAAFAILTIIVTAVQLHCGQYGTFTPIQPRRTSLFVGDNTYLFLPERRSVAVMVPGL